MIRRSFLHALGAALAIGALALSSGASASPDTSDDAGGADVTLGRFFSLISGAKGQTRDRETLKTLFRSDAQFMYARRAGGSDATAATLPSPDSFIDVLVPMYERVGRREKPRWMHGDTKGDLAVIRVQYDWWDEGNAGKPLPEERSDDTGEQHQQAPHTGSICQRGEGTDLPAINVDLHGMACIFR